MMAYSRIKKQIVAELEVHKRGFSDVMIYKFIQRELLEGNIDETDKFMLSPDGGYTPGQLNQIKLQAKRNFNKQSKSIIPISAF